MWAASNHSPVLAVHLMLHPLPLLSSFAIRSGLLLHVFRHSFQQGVVDSNSNPSRPFVVLDGDQRAQIYSQNLQRPSPKPIRLAVPNATVFNYGGSLTNFGRSQPFTPWKQTWKDEFPSSNRVLSAVKIHLQLWHFSKPNPACYVVVDRAQLQVVVLWA